MEVIPKLDRTMPRYPECVWSRAEELEGTGNGWKLWKTLEAAENVRTCGEMSEALECVAGDREDFGRLV